MLFFYIANSVNRWWVFAGILCAVAAFSSTVYRYYAIRCPQCSARLIGVITSPTNPFAAPRDSGCCPFCQVSLMPRFHRRNRPNQSMKSTAPFRSKFSVVATTPCRGLSLFRWA
jgi:hypothetical protein